MTDSDASRYYLDNVLDPSVFYVDLAKVDLSEGSKTMRPAVMGPVDLAGSVSKKFTPAEPYGFLTP